jgi:hypothetical protein
MRTLSRKIHLSANLRQSWKIFVLKSEDQRKNITLKLKDY